ncbi:NAD-dependent epimerase/dehydratase family protein [Microbispora triticiradicis]|uniref:NAD-dependent epimerase/dehydratase family protein n=1 Tax=Microbispora triticiradicis TaxID=2200763 RepID=UPI001FCC56B8|nr:NAD-dependent epimerase/dehydratase family protein [Microbispora fusca]
MVERPGSHAEPHRNQVRTTGAFSITRSRKVKIFITGGSGFVGGTLVHRLVAEGHEVMALARSGPSIQRVRAAGAEPVPGDLAELGRADSPGPTRNPRPPPRRRRT